MAKKKEMTVETGRMRLYIDDDLHVDKIFMGGTFSGVQLSWKGRVLTLWDDGSIGVCGTDLSTRLFIR